MRARVILAALLVIVGFDASGRAQPGAGRWVADPEAGCRVWVGAELAADPVSWSGGCQGGLAQGQGVMRRYAGGRLEAEYIGEYRDGRRDGRGTVKGASGIGYEGEWRDDQYEGQGTFRSPDGSRYEGSWHHGRPSGRGVWVYADGERYEGELRAAEYSGRGVYIWPNGDRYEGEFRSGRPDGPGSLRAHDGNVYEGVWALGCLNRGSTLVAVLLTELDKCQ